MLNRKINQELEEAARLEVLRYFDTVSAIQCPYSL